MYSYKEYIISKSQNSPYFDLVQNIAYIGVDGEQKTRGNQLSFDMSFGYCINRIIGVELGKSKNVDLIQNFLEDYQRISKEVCDQITEVVR